jgi:MYXO-CTERM domain-containing protein
MKHTSLLRRTLRPLLAGTCLVLTASTAPAAIIALDTVGENPNFRITTSGGPVTFGWAFTANADLTVTALGLLDVGGDGFLNPSYTVSLWEATGALVGSMTVGTSDPLTDGFRYAATGPLSLLTGQAYVIGVTSLQQIDYYSAPTGISSFSTAAEITYTGDRWQVINGMPVGDQVNIGTAGYFGPNFQFELANAAGGSPIPEPTTALFGLALVGVAGLSRRRTPALA